MSPEQDTSPELTHFRDGLPRMVDVTEKAATPRTATAEGWVRLPPEARVALEGGTSPKGDPLTVARLGGLAGSKRTADLVLLCHPIPVTGADVRVTLEEAGVRIVATVRTTAPTGVEMEALTAVSVAALNVYDMLKAASKAIEITGVRLLSKTGGKSGDYTAPDT
ncbi:cyclic pyranopterin monophosphate synthase MoaC [Deinococcus sp. S9]|uniref:cyclic pyranopterin monophosphate synthase MoaC n=1 Tax=Deinococcus sp. S9 TaxID=2545754 RepID=UPI00105680B7|nr:cyclic pyranopterin monophosphate synthase MoaC [Deinococcus sp. S9]TDE85118.1 cyclic pyranopterin monophosphate synthase MoaC [Deinococcus sp. S9]